MSIFAEAMSQAIAEYRSLLRRHLSQVERMMKLQQLGLRDAKLYEDDLALYEAGLAILNDVQENLMVEKNSYYAYSGVQQFCEHLREFLSGYDIENDQVVHRAQKASRAILNVVQWMGAPREKLDEAMSKQFFECNRVVATHGSKEQCDLLLEALSHQQMNNPGFYTRIIAHLESMMMSRQDRAAA